MSLKIEVTQDDIDRGICQSPTRCAVARAIRRITGKRYVEVNADQTLVGQDFNTELPKKAQDFIHRFDEDKKKVKPFSFVLRGWKGQA